ncbi:hypothetical protein FNU76_01785 [Chitinimonas arctica]|uniref:Uncharacterized protein n=1 Tax=Chitinimonas arctica TaxID=2594795 RepID=A0A516SAL6_9NEIS|nr:hypothetical protein [Chitinimonas arctica]QDQ25186.1 hypothetical protein FNU76_01785 [Chitinimonas arctica]
MLRAFLFRIEEVQSWITHKMKQERKVSPLNKSKVVNPLIVRFMKANAMILLSASSALLHASSTPSSNDSIDYLNSNGDTPKTIPTLAERVSCSKNVIYAEMLEVIEPIDKQKQGAADDYSPSEPEIVYARFKVLEALRADAIKSGDEVTLKIPYSALRYAERGLPRSGGFPTYEKIMSPFKAIYEKKQVYFLGDKQADGWISEPNGTKQKFKYFEFSVPFWYGTLPIKQKSEIVNELAKQDNAGQKRDCKQYLGRLNKEIKLFAL